MKLTSKKKEEQEQEEPKIVITDEMIESEMNVSGGSPLRAVFYGLDGTGKTGSAIDIKKDKDEVVYILDCDGGSGPIKDFYYPDDNNIKIFNPLTLTDEGEIDYVVTYRKVMKWVQYVYSRKDKENIKAVILDGLDSLQEWAQVLMKIEDLKIDPTAQIKDSWMWEKRNKRVLQVCVPLTRMGCHRILITHLKEIKEFVRDPVTQRTQLKTTAYEPIWISKIPGMMSQKVEFYREDKDAKVLLKAKVHKSKTNLSLEGKEYIVAEVDQESQDVKWFGLKQFYRDLGIDVG